MGGAAIVSDLVLAGAVVAVPAMLLFAVAGIRWPALAVCLIPLSFPIEQLDLAGLPLRVVQLAALGVIGLVAIHQRIAHRPFLPRSALLFAAGLVVLSALVSTVVSVDPVAALRLDAGYLLGLALAATIAVACPDQRSLRLVVACTCAVGTVICAAGLSSASQLRSHYGGSVVDNRATGFFGQPNELGGFAAIMVVLTLALLFSWRRGPMRLLLAASVLVSAAALVVSLSRGSWLGVGLGLAVLAVLAPVFRRPIVRGLVAVVAGATVAAVALPASPLVSIVVDRAASLVDGRRNPYDDRPAIWREALRQIAQRPVLGSGPGGYPVLALRSPSQVTTVAPSHAHDLGLTLTAEQGVLGLVALGIAVLVAVLAVARTLRWHDARQSAGRGSGERELLAGTAAALAVVLGQGLLDYPLRNPVLATMVWLLVGLLAAAVSGRDRPPVPYFPSWRGGSADRRGAMV
jgi:O-antigen ligase